MLSSSPVSVLLAIMYGKGISIDVGARFARSVSGSFGNVGDV